MFKLVRPSFKRLPNKLVAQIFWAVSESDLWAESLLVSINNECCIANWIAEHIGRAKTHGCQDCWTLGGDWKKRSQLLPAKKRQSFVWTVAKSEMPGFRKSHDFNTALPPITRIQNATMLNTTCASHNPLEDRCIQVKPTQTSQNGHSNKTAHARIPNNQFKRFMIVALQQQRCTVAAP